jgi:hypothetical protein
VTFDGKGTPQDSINALQQAIDQDIHFVSSYISSVDHAISDALRKHNITGATIAGGHGTTAKQADIAPALAAN